MQQIFSVEGKSSVVITSEQEEHLKFIGKPLPGLTEIAGQIHKDHAYLLENYGAWMDALVKNEIQPLTEAQRKFIKVAKEKIPGDTCFEVELQFWEKIKRAYHMSKVRQKFSKESEEIENKR